MNGGPRKNRIGGWWRLFILFVIAWSFYSATVVVKLWPEAWYATDPMTADIYTPEYMAQQKRWALLLGALFFITGPALVLGVTGVGRWVYRGFRPRSDP